MAPEVPIADCEAVRGSGCPALVAGPPPDCEDSEGQDTAETGDATVQGGGLGCGVAPGGAGLWPIVLLALMLSRVRP